MVIEEINEIIGWYKMQGRRYNDVHELMYHRARLAILYGTFMEELGGLRRAWNGAQAERENQRAKMEVKLMTQGIPATKATLQAKANTYKLLTAEKEAEGKYYEYKAQADSIKEVLSAMHQHIAQARDEWKLQKFINQSEV